MSELGTDTRPAPLKFLSLSHRKKRYGFRVTLHLAEVSQQAIKLYFIEVSCNLEGDVGGSGLSFFFFFLFTLPFGHQTAHIPFSVKPKIPTGEIIKTTGVFLKLFKVSTALVSGCTTVAFTLLLAWEIKRLQKEYFSHVRLFPVSGPYS